MRLRLLAIGPLVLAGMAAFAAPAAAHPLGNFTINHYARIQVESSAVTVRWVLDMAEIPAFTEVRAMDTSGDGQVSEAEGSTWLGERLPGLVAALALRLDGQPTPLRVADSELTFPPGQGGLPTLRLVVDLVAERTPGPGTATFRDDTFPERLGWREIVARAGAGVRLTESDVPTTDHSAELTTYPADAMTDAAAVQDAAIAFVEDAGAGAPDAPSAAAGPRPDDPLARLVGGDLSPLTAALAVLLAMGLGVAHGVSPGHGKTLVAAYLIGNRGTLPQAIWLGLTVAVTHTLGVFILGAVTLIATVVIVPERVIAWLSLASGILVIGLGVALLWRRLRRPSASSVHAHSHGRGHPHTHSHQAPPGGLSRRGIVTLGLVGGMVPSASALLVLLVAITLDRVVFGLVLIVAFGIGMAAVLAAISVGVVLLRRRVEERHAAWLRHPALTRVGATVPLVSAVAVLVIGLVLSVGAAGALG